MAYVPNNLTVFTAAYAGCISGLVASQRNIKDTNVNDYSGFGLIAGAFSQSFDTAWGISTADTLQVLAIQACCKAVWEERHNLVTTGSLLTSNYNILSQSIIGVITASENYFASQGVTPSAWPSSTPSLGVFNVRDFGAIGNGVANDRPAIVAADAAAAAFGNAAGGTGGGVVYFPNPPVVYRTDQELRPSIGNMWLGTAHNSGECAIQASVAIRSVVVADSNTATGIPVPMVLQGLTFDANGLALYGVLGLSFWQGNIRDSFAINAVLDNYHDGDYGLPLTIGPITVAGGAPPGLVLTQVYNEYYGLGPGATNVVLKIDGTGTKYSVSTDGGVTFGALLQNIVLHSNVIVPASPFVANPTVMMGIQITTLPAGPYPAGGTWSVTLTQNQPAGQVEGCNNIEHELNNFWCGDWDGTFGGSGYLYSIGNVTTAGRKLTFGGGAKPVTDNLGKIARPGDMIIISGAGLGGADAIFPLLGLSDDTLGFLASGETPQVDVVNANYTLCVGYALYRGDISGAQQRIRVTRGVYGASPNGIRLTSTEGDHVELAHVTPSFGVGILIGRTSGGGVLGYTLLAVEVRNNGNARFYIQFGSEGTLIEPQHGVQVTTTKDFQGANPALMFLDGSIVRYNLPESATGTTLGTAVISAPVGTLQLVSNLVLVNSNNQVIPAPIQNQQSAINPTYTVLQVTGSHRIGVNSIVLGAPASYGMFWVIENLETSNFIVGIRDKRLSGAAGDPSLLDACILALAGGERVCFFSVQKVGFAAPVWEQFGPVHRIGTGNPAHGSGVNGEGNFQESTTAAAVVLQQWELATQFATGGMVTANVSARDLGSTDNAQWDRCMCSVNAAGAIQAQIVPSTNATGAFGSAAGNLPPAAYVPSFDVTTLAGFLTLKATTGAVINAQWWETHRAIANGKTPT